MFSKLFKKEEPQKIKKNPIDIKWFKEIEEGYGASRLRIFDDESVDLVWLEESDSPYGAVFESKEAAMEFLGKHEPWQGLPPKWTFLDSEVIWIDP